MVMVMLFFFRFIVRKGRLITTLFLNFLIGMVMFFRCFTLRKRRLLMILILGMVMMLFF